MNKKYFTLINNPLMAEFGHVRLISSYWNKGFVVSRYRKMTRLKSFENILLSGPIGSGKTTRFLLKQLYTLKGASLLINDPQGELWLYASGYLKRHFKKVISINFSDSSKSAGYNPFCRIKKPSDVYKLADLLISATLDKGNGDVFWKIASVNLTQVLMRVLLHQPKEYQNLSNLIRVLQLFTVDSAIVDKWVSQAGDEKLLIDYKEIISMPEKTLMNVVYSVKSALQVFDDPEIARTTAFDTVDFDELRNVPTAIFLNNVIGDQRYISILNSVFFEQFFAFALEKLPSKKSLPIFMILEEFPTLFIPMAAQATGTLRKAKVGALLAVQSHSQLKHFYNNQAEVIKANCRTKIWLTGQTSLEELREVETHGGKRIYKDEKTQTERTVPLISTDAIRMLPEKRSLILSGNFPLILAKCSAYYNSLFYRWRSKIPPVEFERHIPDSPIPMLK